MYVGSQSSGVIHTVRKKGELESMCARSVRGREKRLSLPRLQCATLSYPDCGRGRWRLVNYGGEFRLNELLLSM